MENEKNPHLESHQKWSNVHREYLSYTVNLFLTISIGLVGFVFASLKDEPVDYKFVWLLRFGILFLGFSILLGVFVCYARYKEFKTIALLFISKACNIENREAQATSDMQKWGYRSNLCFEAQLICMLVGILFLSIYFAYSRHIW